jgi:hypothetical protein
MTTQWCFIMSMKPTRAYKDTRIYYIIIVNILHVTAIFCGLLQGCVFPNYMLQIQPSWYTVIQYHHYHVNEGVGPLSCSLTLSLLMLHICVVCLKCLVNGYQKTNKTEDTNKLTLLTFKIIAILHNTRLATFIKLLETVSKGLYRNRSQNSCYTFLDCRRAAAIQERETRHIYATLVG